jgi:hypothetical protein
LGRRHCVRCRRTEAGNVVQKQVFGSWWLGKSHGTKDSQFKTGMLQGEVHHPHMLERSQSEENTRRCEL